MTTIHHINCGYLEAPPNPRILCHCLLLEEADQLVLIETGIGLTEVNDPYGRLPRAAIERFGFQFNESDTAIHQIRKLGLNPDQVNNMVVTHADPDHTGGLADFPAAVVHIGAEELDNSKKGSPRFVPIQFAHGVHWHTYAPSTHIWFGLEARKVDLPITADVYLIPLFGHTFGHCGVAVQNGEKWVLHVGDAYYLRVELFQDDHPVAVVSQISSEDNDQRVASLAKLRQLYNEHGDEIEFISYHDPTEFAVG